MFPLKATSCVPDSSGARIWPGQSWGWDSSVPWGVGPLGKEEQRALQGPESPPEEEQEQGAGARRVRHCVPWMVWLDEGPTAPTASLPCPCLPHPVPSGPVVLPVCQARPCLEDALTSQGVLGHTEAQGLQPVVDVRFSHWKLEFCRGQRPTLVTGALTTRRKYAHCRWLHLQGEGLVRLPARTWGDRQGCLPARIWGDRQDCHGQCVALWFN